MTTLSTSTTHSERNTIKHDAGLLILGAGSVSQCLQPLLMQRLDADFNRITILDALDLSSKCEYIMSRGARFVVAKLTPDNLAEVLDSCASSGDILINLTWNIDTEDILTWARAAGVRYIDTSVEQWDPYAGDYAADPVSKTLYARHEKLRALTAKWQDGPTAVVEHGANPGLVSHWVKRALDDIVAHVTRAEEENVSPQTADVLRSAVHRGDYARVAMETGTRVIHISERDTQISSVPKRVGEFVNTWSVEGFYEEGIAPAELGWGTHEKTLPAGAVVPTYGRARQICLARAGADTWVKSWVPQAGPILGMVIRHGEAISITDCLTVSDDSGDVYRPTVHYAYLPTDSAIASLLEMRMAGYELQSQHRILTDEITSGADELGVLLLGETYGGWWTGSQLDIHETRKLIGGENATTLQVAASVLGALNYVIEHPNEGFLRPDDLDHNEVLAVADDYLGPQPSVHTDWTPNPEASGPFHEPCDGVDGYQISNFLVV